MHITKITNANIIGIIILIFTFKTIYDFSLIAGSNKLTNASINTVTITDSKIIAPIIKPLIKVLPDFLRLDRATGPPVSSEA